MKFKTVRVKGHGRGQGLGFPTINMVVPSNIPLTMPQGVYAARAVVGEEKYNGALYYGSSPTFGEKEIVLEIYLLDTTDFFIDENEPIEVELVKFIRPVMTFELPEFLVEQMEKDVAEIRIVLKI